MRQGGFNNPAKSVTFSFPNATTPTPAPRAPTPPVTANPSDQTTLKPAYGRRFNQPAKPQPLVTTQAAKAAIVQLLDMLPEDPVGQEVDMVTEESAVSAPVAELVAPEETAPEEHP